MAAAAIVHEDSYGLPRNFTKLLPEDPHEQLDLARKITSLALSTRISALEARMGELRETLDEKDGTIEDLQKRIADTDQAIQKTSIRVLKTNDDQMRLSRENDQLQETIFKLKHDVSKLEAFRKSLVQTLRLDHTIIEAMEEVPQVPPNHVVAAASKGVPFNDAPRLHLQQVPVKDAYVQGEDDFNLSKASTPPLADEAKKGIVLFKGRPGRKSMSDFEHNEPTAAAIHPLAARRATTQRIPTAPKAAKVSPPTHQAAGDELDVSVRTRVPTSAERSVTATTTSRFSPISRSRSTVSISSPPVSPARSRSAQGSPRRMSSQPSSPASTFGGQYPTAPNSPLRSQSMPMLNGKEFFRQAKIRLSYERFRALLNTIKELNSHVLTREEALAKTEEIFGEENKELHDFLCQNIPS